MLVDILIQYLQIVENKFREFMDWFNCMDFTRFSFPQNQLTIAFLHLIVDEHATDAIPSAHTHTHEWWRKLCAHSSICSSHVGHKECIRRISNKAVSPIKKISAEMAKPLPKKKSPPKLQNLRKPKKNYLESNSILCVCTM